MEIPPSSRAEAATFAKTRRGKRRISPESLGHEEGEGATKGGGLRLPPQNLPPISAAAGAVNRGRLKVVSGVHLAEMPCDEP